MTDTLAPLTPAVYRKEIRRVRRVFNQWWDLPLIARYVIRIEYCNEGKPDDSKGAGSTTMEVKSAWEYLDAYIRVFVPATVLLDDATLETTVLHELGHIYLGPLDVPKSRRLQEELTATEFARALQWAKEKKWPAKT